MNHAQAVVLAYQASCTWLPCTPVAEYWCDRVYAIRYANCFVVLFAEFSLGFHLSKLPWTFWCSGSCEVCHPQMIIFIVLTSYLPIFFRVASLALGNLYECSNAREVTQKDMDEINCDLITTKYNKARTVSIILGAYCTRHDDVIKWKHFPRYWPFVRRIHRSPVNSPHKGQWRGALMFSLICAWINGWVK